MEKRTHFLIVFLTLVLAGASMQLKGQTKKAYFRTSNFSDQCNFKTDFVRLYKVHGDSDIIEDFMDKKRLSIGFFENFNGYDIESDFLKHLYLGYQSIKVDSNALSTDKRFARIMFFNEDGTKDKWVEYSRGKLKFLQVFEANKPILHNGSGTRISYDSQIQDTICSEFKDSLIISEVITDKNDSVTYQLYFDKSPQPLKMARFYRRFGNYCHKIWYNLDPHPSFFLWNAIFIDSNGKIVKVNTKSTNDDQIGVNIMTRDIKQYLLDQDNWIPARKNGKNVSSVVILPVNADANIYY